MAQRAAGICNAPACGNLTYSRYCEKHTHTEPKPVRSKDHRGSAGSRGYDNDWRKLRSSWIRQHPMCAECTRQGRATQGIDVDHIAPFIGINDSLRLDRRNLQTLCRLCHNRKTHGTQVKVH